MATLELAGGVGICLCNMLSAENYAKGVLIDEELMGGVTEDPQQKGVFVAYVLRHTTGEYLGYQPFQDLTTALEAINHVQRPWAFEKAGGCGGGNCKGGGCGGGGCGQSSGAGASGGGCGDGGCATPQ